MTASNISNFIYKELIKASNLFDFDSADMLLREQLQEQDVGANFLPYYENHVREILREQLTTGLKIGFSAGANWTNNNAESKNKIIKMIAG